MANEKWIPYLMSTSLKKVISGLNNGKKKKDITIAEGRAKTGVSNKEEEFTDVGLTIQEITQAEAVLDWNGGSLWTGRLKSHLSSHIDVHDMALSSMRIRVKSDETIAELLEGKWSTKSMKPIWVKDMPTDDYIYLNLNAKKPDFNISNYNVRKNETWKEYWDNLNKCPECGDNLCEHGFKRMMLSVCGIESKHCNDSLPKKKRPLFDLTSSSIAQWISNNVLKPTKLASPNGMLYLKKETESNWVVEDV